MVTASERRNNGLRSTKRFLFRLDAVGRVQHAYSCSSRPIAHILGRTPIYREIHSIEAGCNCFLHHPQSVVHRCIPLAFERQASKKSKPRR